MKKRYDGSEAEGKSKRYNFTTNKEVSEILEPIKNKADFIREAIVFYEKYQDIYVTEVQQIKEKNTRPLDNPIVDNTDILGSSIVNIPKTPITIPAEVVMPSINTDNLGLTENNILTNLNPKKFLESYNRPLLAKFYVHLLNKSAPKKKPYIIRGILNHYRNLGKLV